MTEQGVSLEAEILYSMLYEIRHRLRVGKWKIERQEGFYCIFESPIYIDIATVDGQWKMI